MEDYQAKQVYPTVRQLDFCFLMNLFDYYDSRFSIFLIIHRSCRAGVKDNMLH